MEGDEIENRRHGKKCKKRGVQRKGSRQRYKEGRGIKIGKRCKDTRKNTGSEAGGAQGFGVKGEDKVAKISE